MNTGPYIYALVGAYFYMGTIDENTCTTQNSGATITFIVPETTSLNIVGTGSDLFVAYLGSGTTSTIACTATQKWQSGRIWYYLNASTLSGISGSTAIYTYGTNTPAPQATYSDGTRWKDWNGSKFVYGGDC